MAWDIYGNHLKQGYCEVHPHIPETYPCSQCLHDRQIDEDRRHYDAYCAEQYQAHIEEMMQGVDGEGI